MQRAAGIIFILAAALVGVVASMTSLAISDFWSYALFGFAIVLFVVGAILSVMRREKKKLRPATDPRIVITNTKTASVLDNHHEGESAFLHADKIERLDVRRNFLRDVSNGGDKDR